MKNTKSFLIGFVAVILVCSACAVVGVIAYSAGSQSQPPAVQPANEQAAPLPADMEPEVCTIKIVASSQYQTITVYEVVSGDGKEALCDLTLSTLRDMPVEDGITAEFSLIHTDPGLPVYCDRSFGTTRAEIQSDNAAMGNQFCAGFLE